jgi:alcohol dehydrogenase
MDNLLPILLENNIKYTIFNDIMENPETAVVDKGCKVLIENDCDFVIAIGGGSPLDAAKAISLQSASEITINEIYDTTKHKKAFPIIAIPTTSGTGSEVTPYSVLNDSNTNIKAGFGSELIFPKIAFLDPKYTISLNKTITRDTTIDALSHLLEGIYSNKHNTYLLPIVLHGIRLIYKNLIPCLDNPADIECRKNIMLASNYGGIVIAHSSTTLQHSIGYPLTTEFGVSHGLANGLVMKKIMDLYEPHLHNRLDTLFDFLKISKKQFFCWLDSLEMKFIGKIDEDFISKRVPEVMRSRNMALNPLTVNEKQIIEIYSSIMNRVETVHSPISDK